MRILLWHGWLLEGSGSNVYTSRVSAALVAAGHDVAILCQEGHPDRYPFIRAAGTVSANGVSSVVDLDRSATGPAAGAVLLRPDIGRLLPVFVIDEYEGFEVKRFVDLTDGELTAYLDRNVEALAAATDWFRPDIVVAGHAVPGPVVARRCLPDRGYVAKIHGSDLEYAIRLDRRYLALAREGLEGARAVIGPTSEVLDRLVRLVPAITERTRVVSPGVDVDVFRPLPRAQALEAVAERLEGDPEIAGGRPDELDQAVRAAIERRDGERLDALAGGYDQEIPDRGAAAKLRALARHTGPVVGYFGKLIPPKGVELLIQAFALLRLVGARCLIVGFGTFREWLQAMVLALEAGDPGATRWLAERSGTTLQLDGPQIEAAKGLADRILFTGRLDHRYAPGALAALDVLVVPSVLPEAFGMVAAEAAAAGPLPLLARHSGLAEVSAALEEAAGCPGLFSFTPGPAAPRRIAQGVERLFGLPAGERLELRRRVSSFVAEEWTWERTAAQIIAAGVE